MMSNLTREMMSNFSVLFFLKSELKYAKKIQKEKGLQQDKFWKGRIYTLNRIIRKLNTIKGKR